MPRRKSPTAATAEPPRWILLIHQIPPDPNYLRVKIGRRLARIGAVAVKSSVYALPRNDQAVEDFQWVVREIVEGGGDASLCEARFFHGLSDSQLEAQFDAARDADYREVAGALREALAQGGRSRERSPGLEATARRLRKQLEEIRSIDFFGAPAGDPARGLLAKVEARLFTTASAPAPEPMRLEGVSGRTWVTRKGIHVDRMACAWLIRRFIDPKARFKFVTGKGYEPGRKELLYDMFEAHLRPGRSPLANFSHEGDRCSFEVLLERAGLSDPALVALAEVIHDIDLKDAKFGRDETAGVDRLVRGIAITHESDEVRLAQASVLFDGLYESFRRKRP